MNSYLDRIKNAFELIRQNNLEEALFTLDEAEKCYNPEDKNIGLTKEDIHLLRGSILYMQQDFQNALTSFEEALKENPESSEACLQLGKTFLELGEFDSAKVMLEWAVNNDSGNNIAKLLLQKVKDKIDNGIFSSLGDDLLTSAYQDFENKRYDSALQKITELEHFHNEKFASLLNFKGFVHLAQTKNELAKSAFERAKTINPESSQAYAGLGEIFYLTNDDKSAKIMFETALQHNPQNKFASAGLVKIEDANIQNPTTVASMIIEKLIEEAFANYSNGAYAEALNRLNVAESEIKKMEYNDPQLISRLLSFKGMILLKSDNIVDARSAFEESLEANPESSNACAGLAQVFVSEKHYDAAKSMFDWALKFNPENASAREGLTNISTCLM